MTKDYSGLPLKQGCLTLFAKLRQSHNLPKLDWHWWQQAAQARRTFRL